MTINNETVRVTVQGNGVQTTFNYSFLIPSKAAAVLYVTDLTTGNITLVAEADWSLAGAGNPAGGTFTYPVSGTPASATQTVTLLRDVPYTQQTNLGNQGAYAPLSVEGALDWLAMQSQQVFAATQNALRVPDAEGGVVAIPSAAQRANKALMFDAVGAPIVRTLAGVVGGLPGVYWCGTAAGTANALALTATPTLSAYGEGMVLFAVASVSNTGATTVDVSGLGAKEVRDPADNPLGANSIVNGTLIAVVGLINDRFRLLPGGATGVGMKFIDATSVAPPDLALAYTATTTTAPAEFEPFLLRVDRNANTGATLSINGGTARSLRNGQGTAIVPGQVIGTRIYPAVRIGTLIHLSSVDSINYVTNSIEAARAGSWWIDWNQNFTDAFHSARILFDSTNGITLIAGGTGAANDAIAGLRVDTLGNVRAFNGLLVGSPGYPPYTEAAPPPSPWEDMGYFYNTVLGPQSELTQDAALQSDTDVGMMGPAQQARHMRATVAAQVIDCQRVRINTSPYVVDLQVAGANTLWSGPNMIWRGSITGLARTQAAFTSVVSDAAASTFTFAGGDPVVEGYKRGDVVEFTGLATAANNNVPFTILDFSGGSNRTMKVAPPPVTDAVADASFTMTQDGSRSLSVTGPALVNVIASQSELIAQVVAPHTTRADVVTPNFGMVMGMAGQSWAARASESMVTGAQKQLRIWKATDPTINTAVYTIDAAAGASALLEGAATVATNYWWNQHTNTPGPNLYNAADPSDQATFFGRVRRHLQHIGTTPGLQVVSFVYGLNDMATGVWAATGSNTPAIWTASQLAMQAWIRTNLGLPGLIFLITPVPSRRIGTFSQEGYNAMRQAQLDAIAADPLGTFRGAPMHPLIRLQDDDHHGYEEYEKWGRWQMRFATRALGTRPAEFIGPRIVGFSATTTTATFEIDTFGQTPLGRTRQPNGFAVWDNTDGLFGNPTTRKLAIREWAWGTSGSNYTLTGTFSAPFLTGGPLVPIYPYGSCPEMNSVNNTFRCDDGLALLELRIGDYVT